MISATILPRFLSLAAGVLLLSASALAQDSSSSTAVMRRGNDTSLRRGTTVKTPGSPGVVAPTLPADLQVTERMQNRMESSDVSDADRQWMRVIYRKLDLDKAPNTPLYYPVDPVDGQENLIRIIFRLYSQGQIPAFEYLDGREVFNEKYLAKPVETLTRFQIPFTEERGSTANAPKLSIDEYDVPSESVRSYYIIERWEFDRRNNRLHSVVEAICPVWQRLNDNGVIIPVPLFWIRYDDLRPYLATQSIFLTDDNNLPTHTIDDFFRLGLYDGEIYKTRNLRNLTLNQIYGSDEAVERARDSIQNVLDTYGDKIWVPGLDELRARADAREAQTIETDTTASATIATGRPARRAASARPAAKPKQPKARKPKTSAPKQSGSSSAARSVRNRKR